MMMIRERGGSSEGRSCLGRVFYFDSNFLPCVNIFSLINPSKRSLPDDTPKLRRGEND